MSYWSRLDAIFFKDANEIKNKEYDYIVVGGGAYGTSFVHRMLELSPKSKILVLEKGNMLLPEHYQNLPLAYRSVPGETTAQPWIMSDPKYNVHGQVPFLGGKALYWNAWVPQPTPAQMADWPQDVIDELKLEWHDVATFIGRSTTMCMNGNTGSFHEEMRERLFNNLGKIPTSDYYDRATALDAAVALNNNAGKTWQRFAPVNVLVNDITKHTEQLDVVLNCEAIGLDRNKLGISHVKTTKGKIEVGKAKVILALGVIEAITLAQPAFKENKLLGRNFIGHFRSQLLVRIPKEAAGVSSNLLQVAALYLSGTTLGREFHTHISCVYNPKEEAQKDELYRVIPDPANMELYMDSDYMYILLQSMAEIKGERSAQSANHIKVVNDTTEVHFSLDKSGLAVWDEIDKVLLQIAHVLANGNKVEYLQSNNTWSTKVPVISFIRNYNLINEAGVMWMGNNSKDSVTDSCGKMHETNNLYVLGGALFPTCGSWNPTYTGMAMAYRLARKFSKK